MTCKVISQASPVSTARLGLADIVAFGVNGVLILRNGIDTQSFLAIKYFGHDSDAGGWRVEKHVRLIGDMSGNKFADIVGFGDDGVWISFNNGDNTFTQPAKMVVPNFSYNSGGWRIEKHLRFLADIRNVGRCDIVGFGDGGVLVCQNKGGGNFTPVKFAIRAFGYDQGWRIDRHLRFLAPVTGSGLQDIVGFGENSVSIAYNNGDGTFAPMKSVLDAFCYEQGWRIESHPRFLADLTGNGFVDIVGCGDGGVYVSLNDGSGQFGKVNKVVDCFGTQQGWQVDKHPRFVADLKGTKRGDIIGFGDAGVYVSFNNGDGTFQPPTLVLDCFGTAKTWQVDKHPRFVVDLTGNGCADIIGFGEEYVYVSFNDGKGAFRAVQKLTQTFAFNNGEWGLDKTVRYVANVFQGK